MGQVPNPVDSAAMMALIIASVASTTPTITPSAVIGKSGISADFDAARVYILL